MTRIATPALLFAAGPAFAHSGPHLHPHDGASWLSVVAALGVIAVFARVALGRVRANRRASK
ncbi:hypothetical protein [Puniceibacterium sp. IMCC21224]|uniref:hypothetical protein n=1 Tax=Puniceibacterium sp. IMCC21224 TaxID=1618204 RepID=UPI00064E0FC8|nr:hypothetical protein [Puniceibacterium sp. IMCC21224]KMK68368.1 hypothetical protein IMCC21224_113250 [Puniceibacterium sp. IMCC21224]